MGKAFSKTHIQATIRPRTAIPIINALDVYELQVLLVAVVCQRSSPLYMKIMNQLLPILLELAKTYISIKLSTIAKGTASIERNIRR